MVGGISHDADNAAAAVSEIDVEACPFPRRPQRYDGPKVLLRSDPEGDRAGGRTGMRDSSPGQIDESALEKTETIAELARNHGAILDCGRFCFPLTSVSVCSPLTFLTVAESNVARYCNPAPAPSLGRHPLLSRRQRYFRWARGGHRRPWNSGLCNRRRQWTAGGGRIGIDVYSFQRNVLQLVRDAPRRDDAGEDQIIILDSIASSSPVPNAPRDEMIFSSLSGINDT